MLKCDVISFFWTCNTKIYQSKA